MARANPIVLVAEYVLLSCLVLSVHSAIDIQKYFSCHRSDPDFNQCVIKTFNQLQPILAPGAPELGLEPFDPMYIPRMEVEQHEGMKMKKVLTDITITGLKDAKLDKADFTKLPDSIEMTWEVPELRVKNNYSMDGVIMGVPYKGKGQSFFNCTGVRNMVKLKTELVKMDGQDYLQVKDIKYTTEAPKTAHVMFTNTLSKDPKLTEATVKFFNENWRSLFEMFKNVRNGNVEKFMKDTMNKALAKFPYEEMFPK